MVGTASVESSEVFSRMLKRSNIRHTVLNAKFHEKEAEIVAQAGQQGAVTIATNMAGRGTDIKLGEGVKDLGGLLVLGTERHMNPAELTVSCVGDVPDRGILVHPVFMFPWRMT